MQHPSVEIKTFLRWANTDWHRMGFKSREGWSCPETAAQVKKRLNGKESEGAGSFQLHLSSYNERTPLSYLLAVIGFVKTNIFWWPLPGPGAVPSPALELPWPLSRRLWDHSWAEFLRQQRDFLTHSFLLKARVRGCPAESYLAEHWNTSPLLCLSSYLYGSPSLQYLLSLYCCRWKEFIPQGKEMLALASEPWARG